MLFCPEHYPGVAERGFHSGEGFTRGQTAVQRNVTSEEVRERFRNFLKIKVFFFFEVVVGAQVVSRHNLKIFVALLPTSAFLCCTMLFPSNTLAQPRDRKFPAPRNFIRRHFITTPTSFPPHAFLKPEQPLVCSVSQFCY